MFRFTLTTAWKLICTKCERDFNLKPFIYVLISSFNELLHSKFAVPAKLFLEDFTPISRPQFTI